MKTSQFLIFGALFGVASVLAGCGGAGRKDAATAAEQPATGRPIALTGDDQMKYKLSTIRATPGEELSVTLTNIGSMPKQAMGHNWILFTAGTNLDEFALAAAAAQRTDDLPPAYADRILAHTRLLGPREEDTVTFMAPTTPGSYPFACSFPGHIQVGMKGVLIIE